MSWRADGLVQRDHMPLVIHGVPAYTTSGAIGKPSDASAKKGRLVLDSLTTAFRSTSTGWQPL